MSLLSIERYRQLTLDTSSSDDDVTQAITDATSLIEDELGGRGLEAIERTETLELMAGNRVYPTCWPLVSVSIPADGEIDGYSIKNVFLEATFGDLPGPFFDDVTSIDVTYVGGWTDETIPTRLAMAIAVTTRNLLAALSTSLSPMGAKSVKVGDVSVTYDTTVSGPGDEWRLNPITDLVLKAISPYRTRRF